MFSVNQIHYIYYEALFQEHTCTCIYIDLQSCKGKNVKEHQLQGTWKIQTIEKANENHIPLQIPVYKTPERPPVWQEGRLSGRLAGRRRLPWGRYHTDSAATPPSSSLSGGLGSFSFSGPECSWQFGSSPLPCGLYP